MDIKQIRKAAKKGDREAQYLYARELQNKNKSKKTAFKYARQSAESGLAEAQNLLGGFYQFGFGVEKNEKQACEFYQLAADQGYAKGQLNVGNCYRDGSDGTHDYAEAAKWYLSSAEQGNAAAQAELGQLYNQGRGVEKDYNKALDWAKKSAEQAYPKSYYILGYIYDLGLGVNEDDVEAVKWYRLGADQNDASSINALGTSYYFGNGIEKNTNEAFRLWKLAADQGNGHALHNIGALYDNGEIVKKNKAKANKYFASAMEVGNSQAFASLARNLVFGNGPETILRSYEGYVVPPRIKSGVELYHKAADEHDLTSAQGKLCHFYEGGYYGLQMDKNKAIFYCQKAAGKGDAFSQNTLGLIFRERGDLKKAEKWLRMAADQKNLYAMVYLARILVNYDSIDDVEEAASLFKLANRDRRLLIRAKLVDKNFLNEILQADDKLFRLRREEEERQKKLALAREKEEKESEKRAWDKEWDKEWIAVARKKNEKPKNKALIDAALFLENGNSTVYYDDLPIESKKNIRVSNCKLEFVSGNNIDFSKVYWSRGTIQERIELNSVTNAWEAFYESRIPCDKCRKISELSGQQLLLVFSTGEARTLGAIAALGDENALVYYTQVEEERILKAFSRIQSICPGILQEKKY